MKAMEYAVILKEHIYIQMVLKQEIVLFLVLILANLFIQAIKKLKTYYL